MPVLGIDVSHHNGPVDWAAVAVSPAKFAYLKATDGQTYTDPTFASHWAAIGQTALLRSAYHFARPSPNLDTALAQAEFFAATVDAQAPRVLPPALDVEVDGGCSPSQVVSWVRMFISHAEQLMRRELMIYTGQFWRGTLGDPIVPELGTRMLWIPRYGSQEPDLPKTWARWDIWQFTDGVRGAAQAIPGVTGAVDCDRWRGTLEELQALAPG